MYASASENKSKNPSISNSNKLSSKPDFDITKDEFERIKNALQKEEFRKLFFEYVEEIQDPENRKLYEKEIKQLEAERGVDVQFINPQPGFVVKTSVDGSLKCFINIAKSDVIEKPKSEIAAHPTTGGRGLTWSIPLAQSQPRDDLDAQNKLCRVYDVIFHPDALYLAHKSDQFRKCLIDTALDAVEREFKVNLDRANLKFPKLQFKGISRPTVIRNLMKSPPKEALEPHPLEKIYPSRPAAEKPKPKVFTAKPLSTKPEFSTPKYNIKHRRGVDMSEFVNEVDAKLHVTVPRELVVEIELPLLKSATDCTLDVAEKKIFFLSERPGAKYRLNIDLPYAVDDKEGNARFDVESRKLCVFLPVKQPSIEEKKALRDTLTHVNREDSGVESDPREELNSTTSSPVEELSENSSSDHKEDDSLMWVSALSPRPFLRPSISYELPPKFDCNVMGNLAAFVLDVRNVEASSLKVREEERCVHLQFYTLGAGYFPHYYAFYVQLPDQGKMRIVSTEAEAWENNVVLTLNLSEDSEELTRYLAGVDANHLKEYEINEKFKIVNNIAERQRRHLSPPPRISPRLNVSVDRSVGGTVSITIKRQQLGRNGDNTTEDEEPPARHTSNEQQSGGKPKNKGKNMKKNKRRSYSESTVDDIKSLEEQIKPPPSASATSKGSPNHQAIKLDSSNMASKYYKATAAMAVPANLTGQQRKQRSYSESRQTNQSSSSSTLPPSFKGILKHYSRYDKHPSTSDSSSSIDDYSSYSCSMDGTGPAYRFSQSFSDIPEESRADGFELSESCKKTVRFSDVIKKQIFRYDSSILGQKKKNQKRRELKQRALQRRLSESDSVDYVESKHDVFYNSKFNTPRPSGNNKLQNNSNNNNKNSNLNNNANNNNNGNEAPMNGNKGQKGKNLKARERLESESSTDLETSKNSMMFHMDM